MKKLLFVVATLFAFAHCDNKAEKEEVEETVSQVPFFWENASIYFLLTDRFYNGNPENDINFSRTNETAVLRGFEGGDLRGITEKIKKGYFTELGINAIWFTPIVEQIHGDVNEGTGNTYGYHGYWAKDWTQLDPNFGTEEDLAELVETAHNNGIRIVLDVVINHTGPVTEIDPVWGDEWVRTSPKCEYTDYVSTVECTLVENLPDILTDSDQEVELPGFLTEKWQAEGRLDKELQELDAFFESTGYPRAPRFYIMKWITDYVRNFGIDAFRVDTAKHTEASIWGELYSEAMKAFSHWKSANPDKILDNNEFFMFGEVYNYNISSERLFDYGDRKVDFFANGFHSLINFEFKSDATKDYETIFVKYDSILYNGLKGKSVINYLSSHDDGGPYDKDRSKAIEAGTKLMLCPGSPQVYYGDETGRSLIIEGTEGDATLRSFMNWEEIERDAERGGVKIRDVLQHWQKLGKFRAHHPAVGMGRHAMISEAPYVFSREFQNADFQDKIVAGLDLQEGEKIIDLNSVFKNETQLKDYYSGQIVAVTDGKVLVDSPHSIVLLGLSH